MIFLMILTWIDINQYFHFILIDFSHSITFHLLNSFSSQMNFNEFMIIFISIWKIHKIYPSSVLRAMLFVISLLK